MKRRVPDSEQNSIPPRHSRQSMEQNRKHSLCILTTVSESIEAFYQSPIEALNEAGFETTGICAGGPDVHSFIPKDTNLIQVEFSRVLSPFRDIKVFWKLYRIFRKHRFDIVQYSTPKASLLASIAAFLARAPIRIYILWGLYYMGQRGLKKFMLKTFERIICLLSTNIVPISREMTGFVEAEGLAKSSKCEVMHNGSACGIDLEKFNRAKRPNARKEIRDNLNIPADGVVIGIVARLTGDKGINELVTAFTDMAEEIPYIYLLVVGPAEEKDRLKAQTDNKLSTHPRIRAVGRRKDAMPYYMAMDIFCLPTYREGFGKTNLEAQAMELPVVSTDVIGPRESIQQGQTGFLVEPKSSKALVKPLEELVMNPELRRKMGQKGRKRVEQMFKQEAVVQAMVEHRLRLLRKV